MNFKPHMSGWAEVIAYAEDRLSKAKRKVVEIEAILEMFRTQAAAGEPSPMELAKTQTVNPPPSPDGDIGGLQKRGL